MDRDFERISAALSAADNKFYSRIGRYVDPSMIDDAGAQAVYKLCKDIANDHGAPSLEVVRQRAAYLMDDGKLDNDTLQDVHSVLELARDSWDSEAILGELVGPVRQAMFRSISKRITTAGVSNREPKFDGFIDDMLLCDKLGVSLADQDVPASEFGLDSDDLIDNAPTYIQMPTGVAELDLLLRGGPCLGSLITTLGDSKSGKSMILNHIGAVAALHNENVGYLSLELNEADVHRRLMAAIAGVSINDLMDVNTRREASQIIKTLYKKNALGKIFVGTFQPKTINERDVCAWFDKQEKDKGVRIRMRIVDYGDLIVSSKREDRESEYKTGFTVWAALKAMANGDGNPNWVHTASQAKRPEWKPGQPIPVLGRGSTGDSRHKYQLSDLFLTMTPQPDISARNGYIWMVDADRHFGATGQATDVVPHMRHMGRMADISGLGL